jgi:hypothetical protein
MQKRKSTDNIEALLEIATRPKPIKVKKIKIYPDIDQFILEEKIVSGKKKIPTYMVYYRYFLWKKTRLVNRRKFLNYFKTKFEKTHTTDGIGYYLSPTGFDLTPIGFFKARAFLRKERDEQKKK